MRKNIEHLKRVRAVVGSDFPIALDCFMALTVPYAMELAQRCAREVPGGVLWLEEPFAPGCTESMAEVKAKVGHLVQLASGEHEHSLKAFHRLLEGKCVDIVQPDVTKAGGISEVRRIIALARTHDVPVVLHAASSFAFHVQFGELGEGGGRHCALVALWRARAG
jgi:L-rhamnonate dehydratase